MTTFPPASIPASEARVLHSATTDRDYLISVALPLHHEEYPEKVWPVIFVLDANWYFGLIVDMVRTMNIPAPQGELPDALIVGIGYPTTGSLAERLSQVMHLRLQDFIAERDEGFEQYIQEYFPVSDPGATGGAEGFLQFIAQELVPLIEAEYRADPEDRTLMGYSSGATFALYTLFQNPELFQRYVVASFDPGGAGEDDYAQHHDSLPVRLHLMMEDTSQAGISQHRSFVHQLRSRNYSDLTLTDQIFPNNTHFSMVPLAFQAGLRTVYS